MNSNPEQNPKNQMNQQKKLKKLQKFLKSIPTKEFIRQIKQLISKKYTLYAILDYKRDEEYSNMYIRVILPKENSLNYIEYFPCVKKLVLLDSVPIDENLPHLLIKKIKNKLNKNIKVEELDAAHNIDDEDDDVQEVDDLIYNCYGDS